MIGVAPANGPESTPECVWSLRSSYTPALGTCSFYLEAETESYAGFYRLQDGRRGLGRCEYDR